MPQPIIEVKHLSKQYKIGADTTYKTLSGSITDTLRSPLKSLKNFNKQNEIFWALKDINFTVNRGEVVGIIGRNGAGKSTLLKVLSRITHPTEGEIRLRGRVGSLLEVGTGFHPELTGRENVYFNGAILGMKKREIDEKFDDIVRFAEIDKFLDTPVKRYSSGMYVRLAFAVAAHMDPEILIVDEVLAVGDAQFQKKCLGKMGEVAEGGRTVLFVSHQMDMIRSLCGRCLLLSHGQILEHGDTEKIIGDYIASLGSHNQAASFEVDNDKSLALQIIRGRVLDENSQVRNNFDVFDQIILEFEYVVHKPMHGLVVNFEVRRNGSLLFMSFDSDTDPNKLELRKKGYYKCNIELPCPLFKPGYYSISTNTGIANMNTFQRLEDVLMFDVNLQSRPSTFLSYAEKRPGLIAVPLVWKTHIIEEDISDEIT